MNDQSNNKKYIKNLVIFLILIGGYTLFTRLFKAQTTEELWNSTWTITSFEERPIRIDLPVKLKEVSSNNDPNTPSYGFESRHIAISLNVLKFREHPKIALDELASRHFEKFSALMNFQNSKVARGMQEKPEVNVLLGSFTLDNHKYQITHFSVQKGTTYYILIIYYKDGDEYGRKIDDRIISSVKV